MSKVMICGLYLPDYDHISSNNELSKDAEIWVINDWYMFTPWIKPDQVWNIHRAPHIHSYDTNRFAWGWKDWYNSAVQNGAAIVACEEIDGIKDCKVIDLEQIEKEAGTNCVGCQISIMICNAAISGYKDIDVIGVRFNEQEYEYQIITTLNAIKFARDKGCNVNIIPDDREHEFNKRILLMWNDIKEIKPYWER